MKKESRKLNLNRETVAPMQSDDLANVNGGSASRPPTSYSPLTTSMRTSVKNSLVSVYSRVSR
jgi:hypothetical protein